ncbi:hypothetical protein [Herbaspirillum huttiense]|uniref:Uncharacterized protein n=2 Tax=Herbaspirillum huttiense TaxID=863372 RepID=A0AAJ2H4V6_9BURK|nr:hypothetical protein [Herbaspirillum huttiense]MDR9836767.1 hypothetical protein [Herbaspirillum huttiense]
MEGIAQCGDTSKQHRRLSHREGGGIPIRLLALNTGRGHCRARIF